MSYKSVFTGLAMVSTVIVTTVFVWSDHLEGVRAKVREEAISNVSDAALPEARRTVSLLRARPADAPDVWGPVLADVLGNAKTAQLRLLAVMHLANLHTWEGRDSVLRQRASDLDEIKGARVAAIRGLGKSGSPSEAALNVEFLGRLVLDKDEEATPFRLTAATALWENDQVEYERVMKILGEKEPDIQNMLHHLVIRGTAVQRAPEARLLTGEEEARLRGELERGDTPGSLRLYQKLAAASEDKTVEFLIQRFPVENEDNRGQIALTLARIGRRNQHQAEEIESFLKESITKESNPLLRQVLEKMLDFLKGELIE